jgi:hypothetical protein
MGLYLHSNLFGLPHRESLLGQFNNDIAEEFPVTFGKRVDFVSFGVSFTVQLTNLVAAVATLAVTALELSVSIVDISLSFFDSFRTRQWMLESAISSASALALTSRAVASVACMVFSMAASLAFYPVVIMKMFFDSQEQFLNPFQHTCFIPMAPNSVKNILSGSGISVQDAKAFIEYGVDVNNRDKSGVTPLYHAVAADNIDLVKLLIANGAKVNLCDFCGINFVWKAASRLDPRSGMVRYLYTNYPEVFPRTVRALLISGIQFEFLLDWMDLLRYRLSFGGDLISCLYNCRYPAREFSAFEGSFTAQSIIKILLLAGCPLKKHLSFRWGVRQAVNDLINERIQLLSKPLPKYENLSYKTRFPSELEALFQTELRKNTEQSGSVTHETKSDFEMYGEWKESEICGEFGTSLEAALKFFRFTEKPTGKELNARYRDLLKIYHPDRAPQGSEKQKQNDLITKAINHYRKDVLGFI